MKGIGYQMKAFSYEGSWLLIKPIPLDNIMKGRLALLHFMLCSSDVT
jgi:hypothetical protein